MLSACLLPWLVAVVVDRLPRVPPPAAASSSSSSSSPRMAGCLHSIGSLQGAATREEGASMAELQEQLHVGGARRLFTGQSFYQ